VTAPTGTPCFISYAHADDDELGGVVDRFDRDLATYYSAITGKSLNIFRDRHSIGWGDNWRERIRLSVQGATVFIPMVTMRYFDSPSCSEELLAFYNNARQLGVTELLLPVVILGADRISATDPREEVRLIEALQYVPITGAWLAGFDSPEWRTLMLSLVRRLEEALASAEAALAVRSAAEAAPPPEGVDDRESDLMKFTSAAEELTPLLEEGFAALQKFAETAGELFSGNMEGLSAGQMNAKLLAGATRLGPVSKDLEAKGTTISSRIAELDADLRAMIAEVQSIDHATTSGLLANLLGSDIRLENVEETFGQIDEVMSVLRSVSILSSGLRKAIRPAIGGIQALRTAFSTFNSWADLIPPA